MTNEDKDYKSKFEEYIKHIEKYINEPIIQNSLIENGSLEEELKNFYGLYPRLSGRGRCPHIEGHLGKENKPKENQPSKLIEIVFPFAEEPLDNSKLSYNQVREDYGFSKEITPGRVWSSTLLFGSLGAFGGGVWYSLINPLIGIPLTLAFGYVFSRTFIKGLPKNPKDRGGYDKFLKLWMASARADDFIKHSYKNYLIEKQLNKTLEEKK